MRSYCKPTLSWCSWTHWDDCKLRRGYLTANFIMVSFVFLIPSTMHKTLGYWLMILCCPANVRISQLSHWYSWMSSGPLWWLMSYSSVQAWSLSWCDCGNFKTSLLNDSSVVEILLHLVHVTFCVNISVLTRSQKNCIELCRCSSYMKPFSVTFDSSDDGWSSSSKHFLRPTMYSCASSEVWQDE